MKEIPPWCAVVHTALREATTVDCVAGAPLPIEAIPVVVAHRAGNHPDSVAPALGRSDVIELDVHVFRGRVEVRHEKVLRPTGRLWEKWYLLPTDAEVPSILEVLDVVPANVPLLVDLKCFTRRAARRIRRVLPDDRHLIVSSRSWWVLGAFGDRPRTLALRSCGNRFQIRLVTLVPGLGARTGIVAHSRLLDRATLSAALTRTPTVFCWAVTTLDRGRELVKAGVSGLIVDDLAIDWADLRIANGDR